MNRKVVLFIVAQLLLLAIFYLTLNSYLNLDLLALDREDTIIVITGSNRTSHKLELSPEFGEAYAGKKVTWMIAETVTDVDSFAIEPKPHQPDVFKSHPRAGRKNRPAVGHLKGQMRRLIYEYSIHWVDKDGNPHPHDPKIAIRPGNLFELLIRILIYVLLVGIISYMTFRKQKSSNTRPT